MIFIHGIEVNGVNLNTHNIRHQNSFKGVRTAKIATAINGCKQNIDIYHAHKEDRMFLDFLCLEVNFKERMPGLSKYEYERWQEMLKLAAQEAFTASHSTYIATVGNKPCGIITFSEDKRKFLLDCICTWPVKAGEKVKLAGKSLFYQMFKNFRNQNGDKIQLYAITNGPYDTVSKYKKLGFKEINAMPHKVLMETNKYNVKNTMNNLEKILEYIPENNPEKVKLSEVLDI